MTAETEYTTMTDNVLAIFGAKLKAAREASGLERKDAAAQLRLNERFIHMMEAGEFDSNVPLMFIRGYIRSYCKLLHLPEDTAAQVLEALKPQPLVVQPVTATLANQPVTSSNYYMQVITSFIVLTLLSLVGIWWYTHSQTANSNQTIDLSNNNQSVSLPLASNEATKLALPGNAKLADATTDSSIATNNGNGGIDSKGLNANSGVDKKGLNSNGDIDKKQLNANGDVDRSGLNANSGVDKNNMDDNDPDETESND